MAVEESGSCTGSERDVAEGGRWPVLKAKMVDWLVLQLQMEPASETLQLAYSASILE